MFSVSLLSIAFSGPVSAIFQSIPDASGDDLQNIQLGICKVKDRADLLLITSVELADAWDAFAIWKTRTGRPTKLVTVGDIDQHYPGRDIQEKIRHCCLDHIDRQHTQWIVLGGDSRGRRGGHVPDRDTNHVEFHKYRNLPTDLYYLSVENWDANNDHVFGQFSTDMSAIQYTNPNAVIGRIPVRTVQDVASYTRKVVEYESKYPEGEFANRMIYTCAVAHADRKLNTSRETVADAWRSGEIDQFFVSRSPWDELDDGDFDLTAENWVTMFNDRDASKIHMHGHGLIDRWVLENHSIVNATNVEKLDNRAAYPVMTTVSCFTGQFDAFRDPCITESMIRRDGGGAIAIVAPSREGIPVFHDPLDVHLMMTEGKMDGTTETLTHFWKHGLKNSLTIGHAFRAAQREMETHARKTDGYHFVLCELNLLGDPSLDIRARPVTPINASVTRATGGDGAAEVSIEGVGGCSVCVWDESDWYATADIDQSGKVLLRAESEINGTIYVSARAPSRNVWIAELAAE